MCYSSHFKNTLTLENQPFFNRMEILIFDTHRPLSAIISPFQFPQHDSSEGCIFTSEKTCDVSVRSQQEASSSKKLFSGNKNRFCQSNLEEQRKS